MRVVDDQAVHITLPQAVADQCVQYIDRCEIVRSLGTQREVLLYWNYDEIFKATHLLDALRPTAGLPDLPSPIFRDYKWPGIFKPFDHQKETASFLSVRRRTYCFNEQGTGKTSAAIWAADYLMELGLVKRVLIICPLSIMYSAWQADLFKTVMHKSAGIAHGSKAKREKVIQGPFEYVIINYDGVAIVREEIIKAGFDLIIVDEANAYKNSSTKRWKTLAKILMPSTRLWLMTGTPASQSPVDAFGLAKLVSPQRVPKYMTAWRDMVMRQETRFRWSVRPESKNIVYNALQPAIRFTKQECLDLPPVMYQTRKVPLTTQVARYYKDLKAQLQIEAAGEQISAVNAAASLSKLLQLSGGAVYTDGHDVVEFDVSPRLQALKEVLDETSRKVVVFVPYLHTIKVVSQYLTSEGISNDIINGDVSAKGRGEIINQFQQQETPRVLVIQPQAASHGVTLTAADTVVFWSPVMSVETYTQCIARIDRVGQTFKMTVVHLQGSEAEKRVYTMLQGKLDSHQKLLDLYKQELEDDE